MSVKAFVSGCTAQGKPLQNRMEEIFLFQPWRFKSDNDFEKLNIKQPKQDWYPSGYFSIYYQSSHLEKEFSRARIVTLLGKLPCWTEFRIWAMFTTFYTFQVSEKMQGTLILIKNSMIEA